MPLGFFKILMLITCFSVFMPAQAQNILLGIYSVDKPSKIYKQYSPIIDYLTDDLTQRLKQPITINLKIFRSHDQAQNAIVTGEIDFARFTPVSYVLVKQRNPRIKLLVMEKNAVTNADSDIHSLNESTLKKSTKHKLARPWMTRSRLNANVFNALQQSLINLKDKPTLNAYQTTGFFKTNDRAFDSVRLEMKATQPF